MYYEQTIKNVVPIQATSLRETVNAYGKYAKDHGYDLICRVDDDMSFKTKEWSKKPDVHKAFVKAYRDIVTEFELNPKLGGVSIAKPRPYFFHKSSQLFVARNKPLIGNHWIRTELNEMPEGVEVMDDIVHSIICREHGLDTLRYMGAYEHAESYKNAGGLQSTDRNLNTIRTIQRMQELYPHRNIQIGTYKDTEKPDIDIKQLIL